MNISKPIDRYSQRWFTTIVAHPLLALAACIVLIAISAVGLKKLVKDPSVDAFIPHDHPSFIASERAKELFGLSDPIVVALVWSEPGAAFEPSNLRLIAELHEEFEGLANVRYDGVTSLASESFVEPDRSSVNITPYIDADTLSEVTAASAFRGWRQMTPHQGTLVSEDTSAAALLIELENSHIADQTYRAILDIVDNHRGNGAEFHVAGLGAVVGFLSETIASDVASLVPLIYIIVLAMVYAAFRSFKAVLVPLPAIIGSVTGSLGLMATLDIPYFAITSALPVVVVAISVADSIYILSAYRETEREMANADIRERVISAMTTVLPPITLTTITSGIGFVAIAAASIMPPIAYFAWFATVGIGLAWLFTVLAVPAMIVLLRLRLRPRQASEMRLLKISELVVSHPRWSLVILVPIVVIASVLASEVQVDRSLVESFPKESAIRIADRELNTRFAGTAFLDVMIESNDAEGLLSVSKMQRIVELQAFMETLPRVQKTVAVTDYLAEIHRGLNGGQSPESVANLPDTRQTGRLLPNSDDAIAQYLLLYEASATPDSLKEEIDANYQHALIRGILNTRYSSEEVPAVEALQAYVDRSFQSDTPDALAATLSGRVNTRYHWMHRLAWTHIGGLALSIVCVFLVSALLLRSGFAAVAAVVPVVLSVIGLYAFMGLWGARLEPATSMFAAISIGVGVDYAIHLVYRLREVLSHTSNMTDAVREAMRTTGRACFFNAAALGLGFGVLTASDLMTLKNFGALIAVAAFASFVAAFVFVPLLYRLGRPGSHKNQSPVARAAVVVLCLAIPLMPDSTAWADEAGRALAEQIDQRDDGQFVRRTVRMQLISKNGGMRERTALILRARDDTERQALIVFQSPKSIRETAFLNHDQRRSDNDQRWLFLPATGRVRRLPVSERGDYFLGTDFTYADIQSELKFDLDDYEFVDLGSGSDDDPTKVWLGGTARTARIAKELGYGEFRAEIDTVTMIPIRTLFSDPKGRLLKTIAVTEIGKSGDIYYAKTIEVTNHRSGHRTVFDYEQVEFPGAIESSLFAPSILRRGLSRRL